MQELKLSYPLGARAQPGAQSRLALRDGLNGRPRPSYEQVVKACERGPPWPDRGRPGRGPTATSAAHVIRNTITGSAPPHRRLEHALFVLLTSRGVEMTPDNFCSSLTRDSWSEAHRVHRTEVDMTEGHLGVGCG